MAHRRSVRGFARDAPQRRLTQWTLGPGGDDSAFDTVGVAATSNIIYGSGVTFTERVTVVRIRGVLEMSLRAADANGSGFTWTFGIGITTVEAFTGIGVTAVPKPFANAGWPGWLYHTFGTLKAPSGALSLNQLPPIRMEVDTKAMRKLRFNDVIFAVAEFAEVASATLDTSFVSRMLVKLA